MTARFHVPGPLRAGLCILSGEEAHHLSRVRRAVEGFEVEIFDGEGTAYAGRVIRVARDRVEIELSGDPLPTREPETQVVLATAVPKGDRFDWLVEKATELGVALIVPLQTKFSVVEPRPSKLERLRRVALEAAKQSGRSRIPDLEEPIAWERFLDRYGPDTPRYLADVPGSDRPNSERSNRVSDLRDRTTNTSNTEVLAVGPEGGWSIEERAGAHERGWNTITLTTTILRVETAALLGVGALLMAGRSSRVRTLGGNSVPAPQSP